MIEEPDKMKKYSISDKHSTFKLNVFQTFCPATYLPNLLNLATHFSK